MELKIKTASSNYNSYEWQYLNDLSHCSTSGKLFPFQKEIWTKSLVLLDIIFQNVYKCNLMKFSFWKNKQIKILKYVWYNQLDYTWRWIRFSDTVGIRMVLYWLCDIFWLFEIMRILYICNWTLNGKHNWMRIIDVVKDGRRGMTGHHRTGASWYKI